jgi:hypothetical protein
MGVGRVQIDLVVRAVQPELDGGLGRAAVEVVDDEGPYLPGHAFSVRAGRSAGRPR